jgi:hypothetical protein
MLKMRGANVVCEYEEEPYMKTEPNAMTTITAMRANLRVMDLNIVSPMKSNGLTKTA